MVNCANLEGYFKKSYDGITLIIAKLLLLLLLSSSILFIYTNAKYDHNSDLKYKLGKQQIYELNC